MTDLDLGVNGNKVPSNSLFGGRRADPAGKRLTGFLLPVLVSAAASIPVFSQLWNLGAGDEKYTHLVFMPFIVASLIVVERRRIFGVCRTSLRAGLILVTLPIAAGLLLAAGPPALEPFRLLQAQCGALVCFWIGAFLLFFGDQATRSASFPLCLLIGFVPLPPAWLDSASILLQRASAEVTHLLFNLTGAPFFRQGMRFTLPGLTIEVAEECSGIRSGIGLVIAALVAGHLLLRSVTGRVALVLLAIPITIFKNAIRIVTLSILGTYVSRDYITGDLHHRGGPVFAVLSFALLAAVLHSLIRLEGRRHRPVAQPAPGSRPPVGTTGLTVE